jgi:hypothetical protein
MIGGTMKRLFLFAIVLPLLIPLARTAFAAPAGKAETQLRRLPINGTMRSNEIYELKSVTMSVRANGSGTATQIGQFTLDYQGKVDFSDLSTTEMAHFTGMNGDRIDLTGVGQTTESNIPSIFNIIQIYKVTGGTGQYAGASGTITLKRTINISSGLTAGTFDGYILLP